MTMGNCFSCLFPHLVVTVIFLGNGHPNNLLSNLLIYTVAMVTPTNVHGETLPPSFSEA